MSMSDEDWERCARSYCKLMGADPDEIVAHGAQPNENGFVPDVLLHSHRWQLVVPQLQAHDAMNRAMDIMKGAI